MSYASGTASPSPPTTYATFRSFYVIPTDPLPSKAIAIDFFVGRAADGVTFENWQYLGRGDNVTGLYWVHGGLDENTSYAYYIQYIFQDGSRGPVSGLAYAGSAQLIITSSLNIDQLASRAYATGLITSGIFRGTIFQTAATDPRVQMDPSGIFATSQNGTKTFSLDSRTGSISLMAAGAATPVISGGVVQNLSSNPTISMDSSGLNIWNSGIWFRQNSITGPIRSFITGGGTSNAASATLGAILSTGGASEVTLNTDGTTDSNNYVLAFVTSIGGTVENCYITDALGRGSFLRFPDSSGGGPDSRLSATWFGAVTSAGAVRLNGSGSWSVNRTAVGVYTLTLSNGPNGIWPIVTVQINEQSFGHTEVDYVNTTTMTVKTFVGGGFNVAADENWSFHAFASQN